jgi:4-hydroxybenzoate polyprenyltransferase
VQAGVFTVVSFVVMLFAASKLPPICLWLSPIAIFWLSFYSFTKRFTWMCHLVLGIALGGAALGGWVAAAGNLNGAAPWLLAIAVACWVAGFDIIYACQDTQFDREKHLFSIPANFGIGMGLGINLCLGVAYDAGVLLVAAMLVYEHSIVSEKDLSRVNAAFFTTNGVVSIAAFLAILIDKLLRLNII